MIDFPASPTLGQVFTSGAQSWTWDGAKWVASGVYVGPPQFSNANRIINGDMRIDQRNNGAVTTPVSGGYVIDRWKIGLAQASKFTTQSVTATAGGGLVSLGFGYFLSTVSTSAYAAIATDNFNLQQFIEADMITDFAFGTANAQPITLSFWANSSTLTGTFSGAIVNVPTTTRSYPFTFSIPAANIWTKIVIPIPGDTTGTWVMSGNAAGLIVRFDLGSGANFRSSAGSWQAGNFVGANGAVSVVGTNGATFNLTGVKLEIGSIATPFNRKSPQESMADCQRYYQVTPNAQILPSGYQVGGGNVFASMLFPVTMRAQPTVVYSNISYTNASALMVSGLSQYQILNQCTITTVGFGFAVGTFTASAEL